ncbi:MAG: class I SAM-dependent methyltransferase [Bacteroidia bacterium]|nr:class I SAM-dependent methyltransferase [Bacteroidia bacterium]
MNQKITECIICKKTRLRELKQYDAGELVQCHSCGMIFSSKIPTPTELANHYKGYAFFSGLSSTTIKRYNQILDHFEKYRKTNRILDVGCGEGFFLEQAVKRGWEAYGTECVPQYISVCANKNIKMKEGVLNINDYQAESFDIITSFEVLEHLHYPVQEVNNFNKLLRKEGLVYITTPNFNSLSRRIQGKSWRVLTYPDHLCYFAPKTLHSIMKLNSFTKVELLTTGISFEGLRKNIWGKNTESVDKKDDKTSSYEPEDRAWQERIEKSILLRIVKSTLNWVLSITGSGDGIKATYRKLN